MVRRRSCNSYHTRPRATNSFRALVLVQKRILPHTLSFHGQSIFQGLWCLDFQFDFYLASFSISAHNYMPIPDMKFHFNSFFMNRKSWEEDHRSPMLTLPLSSARTPWFYLLMPVSSHSGEGTSILRNQHNCFLQCTGSSAGPNWMILNKLLLVSERQSSHL